MSSCFSLNAEPFFQYQGITILFNFFVNVSKMLQVVKLNAPLLHLLKNFVDFPSSFSIFSYSIKRNTEEFVIFQSASSIANPFLCNAYSHYFLNNVRFFANQTQRRAPAHTKKMSYRSCNSSWRSRHQVCGFKQEFHIITQSKTVTIV